MLSSSVFLVVVMYIKSDHQKIKPTYLRYKPALNVTLVIMYVAFHIMKGKHIFNLDQYVH